MLRGAPQIPWGPWLRQQELVQNYLALCNQTGKTSSHLGDGRTMSDEQRHQARRRGRARGEDAGSATARSHVDGPGPALLAWDSFLPCLLPSLTLLGLIDLGCRAGALH